MNSDHTIDNKIRVKTAKGKALAQEEIISYWERKYGCVLRELKPGPKKKGFSS